jgi:VWFA-related protein
LLILVPALVAAQGPGPPRVSSGVEVVRVDVAVTGRKGVPVADLSAGDFEVREDGAPRAITSFAYVAVGAPAPAPAEMDERGASAAESRMPAPPSSPVGRDRPAAPAPVRQRRVLAFVVDDLNLSRASMTRVRSMLQRFVDESLLPDDLVGVFRTGRAPSGPTPLGADAAALRADIAALSWLGESGRDRPVDPIEVGFAAPVKVGKELDRRRPLLLADASLRSLQSVVAALRPLEGRKAVLFVSDGLKVGRSTLAFDRLQEAASAANRESLVVYTLDPRGVQPLNMDAADFVTDPGFDQIIREEMLAREASYDLDHDGLERLADATGGLFVHDTDPLKGLDSVLRDHSGYYLLGFEAAAGEGPRYHRVSVTARRAGVRVRARGGYWSGRPGSSRGLMLPSE